MNTNFVVSQTSMILKLFYDYMTFFAKRKQYIIIRFLSFSILNVLRTSTTTTKIN